MTEENKKKKQEFFNKLRALLAEYNVVMIPDFELENEFPVIEFHGRYEKGSEQLWMFSESQEFNSESEDPEELWDVYLRRQQEKG